MGEGGTALGDLASARGSRTSSCQPAVNNSFERTRATRLEMPTMATGWHDMTAFSQYARSTAVRPLNGSAVVSKREKERRALEEEEAIKQSLLRRAGACTAIADIMCEQNEKMLAGLRSLSAGQPKEPYVEVNFIKRNMANVSPHRSLIGKKEQALIVRAEVMAAATSHLDSGSPTPARKHLRSIAAPAANADSGTEALLRAARDEIERSSAISVFEEQTRRPPKKLQGLARPPAFSPSRPPAFSHSPPLHLG